MMIRKNEMAILPRVLLSLCAVLSLLLLTTGCSSDDDNANPANPGTTTITVTSIDPDTVSTNNTQIMAFTGTGFVNPALTIGGTSVPNLQGITSTSFNVQSPVHQAGSFDVVVTNSDGTAFTVTNGITFVAPVTLTKQNWIVDLLFVGGSFRIDADLVQNGDFLTGDFFYSSGGTNFQVATSGLISGDQIDVTFTLDAGTTNEATFRCVGQLVAGSPQTFTGTFTGLTNSGVICGTLTPCTGTFEFR